MTRTAWATHQPFLGWPINFRYLSCCARHGRDAVVDAAHEQFKGTPIRDFVPVFVERLASEELDRTTP
jgi:hypothetical protein